MNDIVAQVTPLTRGVLWFPAGAIAAQSPTFQALDYLLDGLLTSSLSTTEASSSRTIIGKSFNNDLYVFVAQEVRNNEFDSFLRLVRPQLKSDNDLIVIDEAEIFSKLRNQIPKDLGPQFRML
jgi:hypothetical protein